MKHLLVEYQTPKGKPPKKEFIHAETFRDAMEAALLEKLEILSCAEVDLKVTKYTEWAAKKATSSVAFKEILAGIYLDSEGEIDPEASVIGADFMDFVFRVIVEYGVSLHDYFKEVYGTT